MFQEALHAELMEARAAYEKMGSKLLMNQSSEELSEPDDEEMDLSPMLKVLCFSTAPSDPLAVTVDRCCHCRLHLTSYGSGLTTAAFSRFN